MRFPELVYRNIVRRPFRATLTLVALATAMTAIVSLLGISRGFRQAFADVYTNHAIDIVVSRQGAADRLSSSVAADLSGQLAMLPQVARTAGVLLETVSLEDEGVYGIPTMGLAADSWLVADYELIDVPSVAQRASPFSASDGREVLVGENLAGRLGLSAGSTVSLFTESFRVAGVFRSHSVWENGSLIMPLSTLQRLTGRDSQVTYINVVLNRESGSPDEEAVTRAIEAVDPRLLALATDEFVKTDTRLKLADGMAWMTSIVAMVIGGIGTLNTMMTSVHERTREIGILRALGWPRQRIMLMILMESCGLALAAAALGSLAAFALTSLISRASATGGMIAPVINAETLGQGLAIALGIGLIGAWLPARRAARLLPTEAFREIS
jgi:putative ABC transport system permease protein